MLFGPGLVGRGFLLFVGWGLLGGGIPFAELFRGLRWWKAVLFVWRHYLNLVYSDVSFGNVLIDIDLLTNGKSVASRLNLHRPFESVVIGEMGSSFEWRMITYFVRWGAQVGVKNGWGNEMG